MSDNSHWQSFTTSLRKALEATSSGKEAQIEMAPLPDIQQRFDRESAKNARQSAVMILLYKEEEMINFPLIVRPQYPGVHSGQIALPGGKYEDTDQDLIYTALRETEEEIGVGLDQVEVLGQLSELYVPPSNFNILPVVGMISDRPNFVLQETEVDELIIANLPLLNDKERRKEKEMTFYNGTKVRVPYFDVQGKVVWGATAMILSEFATIINQINSQK
ncbi:MAG: CoA pyrophosphatase [Reichenbachiella sp.]|uniref:NUDIX hydrolase n=1 Tax=Reichenbachiella sp. TaxID=2184521 RepID=UPI003264E5AB